MKHALPLIMLIATSANAQTFTDRLQKKSAGQGSVTIYQDKTIENLVNGKEKTTVSNLPAKKTTAQESKAQPATTTSGTASASANQPQRKTYTIAGYRIQLYSGNDSRIARQKARAVGLKAKEAFPELPVYTHFLSPRWICRIGDFRTYEEAATQLQKVRKEGISNEASIVKCKIQVGY